MHEQPGEPERGGSYHPVHAIALVFLLLLLRGVLLWLVVPVTFLSWLRLWPALRRKRVSLGQLVGWADLNLLALIERTILRPLVRFPRAGTPLSELPKVTHQVGALDLA